MLALPQSVILLGDPETKLRVLESYNSPIVRCLHVLLKWREQFCGVNQMPFISLSTLALHSLHYVLPPM